MKKLITFLSIVLLISCIGYSQDGYTRIYCKPDLEKCIENLENLEAWVDSDYKNGKINGELRDEYMVVISNTIQSIGMVIDDKGQCDLSQNKEKLKYTSK